MITDSSLNRAKKTGWKTANNSNHHSKKITFNLSFRNPCYKKFNYFPYFT